MSHAGIGWVMQGWGGSCRGRVGHVWVGWGGSCRAGVGGVAHVGVGLCKGCGLCRGKCEWVMQGQRCIMLGQVWVGHV